MVFVPLYQALHNPNFVFFQGYVGLLLGVAIFHLADLVNIFLDRRILGYQKMLENEEKDIEEEASELYQVIKNEDSITS